MDVVRLPEWRLLFSKPDPEDAMCLCHGMCLWQRLLFMSECVEEMRSSPVGALQED